MRTKAIAIVGAITIVIFVSCYIEAITVFLPSFADLEKHDMQKRVVQATNALKNEFADLDSKSSDWAFWDDTYLFVQGKNDAYVETNLIDSTWVNLRLNFILLLNAEGQVVYSEAFNYTSSSMILTTPMLFDEIEKNPTSWIFSNPSDSRLGIITAGNETSMLVAKPVLTSLYEGPIVGTLIMGRFIDADEITYLSEAVGLPASFALYDKSQQKEIDFQTLDSALSETTLVGTEPLNSTSIAGYAVVDDVFSNPAVLMMVTDTRETYAAGLSLANNYVIGSFFGCLALGAGVILVIEKGLVAPIRRLTDNVKKMASNEAAGIRVSGKDETALLAEAVKDTINQRLSAIEEVSAMIGHDLRNPLTGIAGAAYYIKKNCDPEMNDKGREMIKTIENSVTYSNKIVSDLLEYSRKIVLTLNETTPKALVADALSFAKIPTNVTVIDKTEDEPKIRVDVDKLRRALLNIINNASDAMPNGGSLTISTEKSKKTVNIIFEDTGTGMSKETLEKIGSPLFTTKAKGMGLGFSIAKRFIEAHDGAITVKSTEHKGTTMTVTLPIENIHLLPAEPILNLVS